MIGFPHHPNLPIPLYLEVDQKVAVAIPSTDPVLEKWGNNVLENFIKWYVIRGLGYSRVSIKPRMFQINPSYRIGFMFPVAEIILDKHSSVILYFASFGANSSNSQPVASKSKS